MKRNLGLNKKLKVLGGYKLFLTKKMFNDIFDFLFDTKIRKNTLKLMNVFD